MTATIKQFKASNSAKRTNGAFLKRAQVQNRPTICCNDGLGEVSDFLIDLENLVEVTVKLLERAGTKNERRDGGQTFDGKLKKGDSSNYFGQGLLTAEEALEDQGKVNLVVFKGEDGTIKYNINVRHTSFDMAKGAILCCVRVGKKTHRKQHAVKRIKNTDDDLKAANMIFLDVVRVPKSPRLTLQKKEILDEVGFCLKDFINGLIVCVRYTRDLEKEFLE
jgi:hypothetical protein